MLTTLYILIFYPRFSAGPVTSTGRIEQMEQSLCYDFSAKVWKSLDFSAFWGNVKSKCKWKQKVCQEFLQHSSFSVHTDGWSVMDSSVDGQWQQKVGSCSW